jgi:hypothetical protein
MQKRTYWVALGLAALLGCGTDSTVREVRELRISGHLPEAREHALAALQQDPSHLELWLEFAHTAVDQTRQAEREQDPQSLNYLVEASLLCGGYYKFQNQDPPKDWRDVSRLAAGEAVKQGNITLTTLRSQSQSADYLNQLLTMRRGDSGMDGAQMSAAQMVEGYRAGARDMLFQSVLVVRLLEMLPEVSSGSSTILVAQIQSARDEWRQALELPADLVDTMTQRANHSVDTAFNRVLDDFRTLGYAVPETIIENGILGS